MNADGPVSSPAAPSFQAVPAQWVKILRRGAGLRDGPGRNAARGERAQRRRQSAGTRLLGALAVLGLLAGCAQVDERLGDVLAGGEPDYKSSKRLPSLEVPPDLSTQTIQDTMQVPATGSASWSDYDGEDAKESDSSGLLLDFSKVRVERSGDERWLVVDAAPDAVWPQVKAFWLQQGFAIEVDEPGIGIMETDWAEERTKFPGGVFGRLLGELSTALTGAAVRDKFRTRLERGAESGVTEIFISHRGAEEVGPPDTRANVQSGADARRVWQPRTADPELEAEMLTRMMVFFGVQKDRATRIMAEVPERPARARIVKDSSGGSVLSLDDDFARAWRRTGLALDRIGFTVEDRDRSQGLYFVRYADPDRELEGEEGLLSRLAFWRDEPSPEVGDYLINLIGGDEATQVIVLDTDGERSVSATADRILGLLLEQLK